MVVKEENSNITKMYIFNPSTENVDIITLKETDPKILDAAITQIKEEYAAKPTKRELEEDITQTKEVEIEVPKEKVENMHTVMEIDISNTTKSYQYNKNMSMALMGFVIVLGIMAAVFTYKIIYKK